MPKKSALPDTAPRAVELSLLAACPVRCPYCPQDRLKAARLSSGQPDGSMTQQTALQCVRNASASPDGPVPVEVHLAGFSEPLLSPVFVGVLQCLENLPACKSIVMYSTGNGLTSGKLDALKATTKLTLIDWHVRPAGECVNGKFWTFIEAGLLDDLPCYQRATLVRYDTDRHDRRQVEAALPFGLRYLPVVSRSNNVSLVQLHGPTATGCVTCRHATDLPRPVVLPSGDAFACCNDYGLELPIGNLLTQTWNELDFARIRQVQAQPALNAPCHRACHLAKPS